MVSYRETSEGAERIAGDNGTSLTAPHRSELVRSYCCEPCTEASVLTGQPGTTPFNGPFVGRSVGKLVHGDVIRTMGSERPHMLGDVSVHKNGASVIWRDRTERESLTGAIALSVLRLEELPLVPGAGLMPINGEL